MIQMHNNVLKSVSGIRSCYEIVIHRNECGIRRINDFKVGTIGLQKTWSSSTKKSGKLICGTDGQTDRQMDRVQT